MTNTRDGPCERALEKVERRIARLEKQLARTGRVGPEYIPLRYERGDIVIAVEGEMARKRAKAARKEPHTVAWIESSLRAGDVLYDIGSNIGAYSLIAAVAEPGLRVVAFEPGYATFKSLCTNIVANRLADRISPFPVMLGSETGLSFFRYRSLEAGAALHQTGPATGEDEFESRYDQPVMSYRLDDFLDAFSIPPPTHLKLDVDGGELDVIEGAARTLRSPAVRSLMIEVESRESERVSAVLGGAGFVESETYRGTSADGTPRGYWYALYERKTRS